VHYGDVRVQDPHINLLPPQRWLRRHGHQLPTEEPQ
jgi:hypothetical protein